MNIKQIIEIGCTKRKLSITDLAAKMGTSKQNLFNKLYRNDIKTSDLEKLCNELDISIKFYDNQVGNTMTNNELYKLLHPTLELPKCEECGKEINLTMDEIYDSCLVSHKHFLEGRFKGLCPECTRKWEIKKIESSPFKEYNSKPIIFDI